LKIAPIYKNNLNLEKPQVIHIFILWIMSHF
jgi:hypothetical protein